VTGCGRKTRLLWILLIGGLGSLVLPGPAAAGLSVGHSGWEWSNPLPQGNTLRALSFAGRTGFAAGDFGTLLRSDDGGQTWTGLRTGTTEDLTDVEAYYNEGGGLGSVFAAGGCTMLYSFDGGKTLRRLRWREPETRCDSPITGFWFAGERDPTGDYVLSEDGTVYRNYDGSGWEAAGSVPASVDRDDQSPATDITFEDYDLGFATTRRGIYRTTDRGVSWTLVVARTGGFESVDFAGEGTGYAVGRAGAIYRTADNGRTWSPAPVGAATGTLDLTSIRCWSASCIVTTSDPNRLLRTLDGGNTWDSVFLPGSSEALATSFTYGPADVGPGGVVTPDIVAAGSSGAIAISVDRGGSWSPVGSELDGSFARLRGGPGFLAFAIGNRGGLARTSDGGRSWSSLSVPTSEALVDVSFADDTHGVVLDLAGTLFRTDDGGVTWQAVGSNLDAQAVLALSADVILLVGPRGIQRSFDGGQEFEREGSRSMRRAVLFGIDFAEDALFAYGPTSLYTSRDGGTTWRKLGRPDHRPLAEVDFIAPRVGFALGKGGRVWRTRNRGRSWRELLAAGTDGGIDLAFSNEREGYLAANDLFFAKGDRRPDYVLRTVDGGQSWRPQLVSGSRDINSILTTGESIDILLAGGDEFFSTTTGGALGASSSLTLTRHRKRLSKPRTIAVRGRLSPAVAGEQVIVSRTEADPRRRRGAIDWHFKTARVHSDGSFVSVWRVRRTSVFVAQWPGNGELRGAGSRVLKVRVRGR
jgi:photosystem II stability/assembly factor-like uncharacterized protein